MTDALTDNGLPVEAQPWVRRIERYIRDSETKQEILATNTSTAIGASGRAVTASANSIQAQKAAQYQARRLPATLDSGGIVAVPSTYFDSLGSPHGRLDITITPNDLDVDGNPLVPGSYQAWVRAAYTDPDAPEDQKPPVSFGPEYLMLGVSPNVRIQVNSLQPGVKYQIRVCGVSTFGISGELSDFIEATIPATLSVMLPPDKPELKTGAAVIVATWSGLCAGSLPPSQFRYTYAELSPAGTNAWERVGNSLVRGGGDIQISRLTVGDAYDVGFIAVDSLGVETARSEVATITVLGVDIGSLTPEVLTVISGKNKLTSATTAPSADGSAEGDTWFQRDLSNVITGQWVWLGGVWIQQTLSHQVISSIDLGSAMVGTLNGGLITAKTIGVDQLVAGSITVNELSPTIGDTLDISANGSINIIAGKVQSVSDGLDSTADSLDQMQTYYSYGPDGALISSPGSPSQVSLRNDGIKMLENGTTVSSWSSGQFIANSIVALNDVNVGNLKIEVKGDHTVFRVL